MINIVNVGPHDDPDPTGWHDHDMWFLCEIADRIEYCEKKFASTRFFNWAAWQPINRGEPCPW